MVMTAALSDGSVRQVAQVTDRVAGVGAPQVAQHAIEELGAALLIPYRAALGWVRDVWELRYRLPRLWELVQAGSLQTWRARQVTALTTEQLGELGDHSPWDVRRSHALALLGRPQAALDFTAANGDSGPATGSATEPATEPSPGAADAAETCVPPAFPTRCQRPVLRPRNRCSAQLHVHVSLADLVTAAQTTSGQQLRATFATANVERIGAATLDLVPAAASTPGPATRTTASPSCRSTRAVRRGGPPWTHSLACAGGTTA